MRYQTRIAFAGLLPLFAASAVSADYRDDVGYTALQAALGIATPTGAAVNVTQVEAPENDTRLGASPIYAPNPGDSQFSGKTLSFPLGNASGSFSGHATSVGQLFYGAASSMAPGITSVNAYEADAWLTSLSTNQIVPTGDRVANHSWVGDATNANTGASQNPSLLRRVDRLVYQQQYIQVVAMNNGGFNEPLLGSAYNVIAVGRTDANHAQGSAAIDGAYTAGRTRPDLVSPVDSTSGATPIVAAAAALLVQTGHGTPSLSHGSTTVNGATIYNAERSETVKAALLAGADRVTANTSTTANISGYRSAGHQTANGLDDRYGAGQVDVFSSYHIIAAGEQEAGAISDQGFDYNASFGGATSRTANYTFTAQAQESLSASLAWNLGVSNNANLTTTLHHLNLSLFDLSDNAALVADSSSALDNTQNLWVALLDNHQYQLRVTAADPQNFSWGYALAWNIGPTPVPAPAAAWLFASALAGLGVIGRRGRLSLGP